MPSNGNQFAIFRIEKLRTPEDITRVGNHNDRRGLLPDNVDPAKIKLNKSYLPNELPLLDRVMAKLEGKKYRHDAVKAVEIVCTFSPGSEKFVPVEEWAQASLDFIKKKFGAENLISAQLHLDEKTPHLQCVIVPLVGEKLAAKRIFGTRQKMRELQSGYFESVKKFGLARGTKGSNRPHLTMAEMYGETQEGQVIVQKALAMMPVKKALQSKEAYQEKLHQYLTTALEPLTTAKTAATLAALELESLRRIVGEAEQVQKLFQDRLRSLDLRQVAERLLGYSGIKDGKSTVFEDDARKVVITGNFFQDHKSNTRAERGAISLTRHILGVDFETAVRVLSQHFPDDSATVTAEAVRESEEIIKTRVEKSAGEKIDPDEKIKLFATPDPDKLTVAIDYLEKIKGIPKAVVKRLVAESKIWANRWGSVCFLRESSEGNEKGVTIFHTSTNTQQSLGAKNAVFHLGNFDFGKPVVVTESPVAALSYHCMTEASVIATDGETPTKGVIGFLKALFVKNVVAAYSSNAAGETLAEELFIEAKKVGITVSRQKPPQGGWNCALQKPTSKASSPSVEENGLVTPELKKGPVRKEDPKVKNTPSFPSISSPQLPQQEVIPHQIKKPRDRKKVRVKKGPSKR